MCIAIFKPKDKILNKEILETCSKNNPDGIGFSYIDKDKMYIKKFMKFEDFYAEYKKVETKSNMLIHFRIATHGKVELDNCHPFWLNNRMSLIHNGIISGYGDRTTKSDTRDFIDKVIGNISWKMWKNPSFRELVGNAIGYSKLVILDITGDYFIINESKGKWDDGVWYSNDSYKPKQVTYISNYTYTNNKTNQTSFWDMYGEEDYDTWYKKTQSKTPSKEKEVNTTALADDNIIYKCKDCGAEIIEDYDVDDVICNVCKSTNLQDVGIIYRNEKYYYEDIKA